MEPLGNGFDDDVGARKPVGVGELLTIVDDVEPETDVARDFREMKTDVPGADNEEPWGRCQRVDMYVHTSATDQSVFLCEVIVQFVV